MTWQWITQSRKTKWIAHKTSGKTPPLLRKAPVHTNHHPNTLHIMCKFQRNSHNCTTMCIFIVTSCASVSMCSWQAHPIPSQPSWCSTHVRPCRVHVTKQPGTTSEQVWACRMHHYASKHWSRIQTGVWQFCYNQQLQHWFSICWCTRTCFTCRSQLSHSAHHGTAFNALPSVMLVGHQT